MEIINLQNQEVKVKDTVATIKDNLLDGNLDGVKVGIVLKKLAKISDELLKDPEVKDAIYKDSVKYLGETILGGKISESATSTWYDFSICEHPELNQLYEIQTAVKERIKQLEEELKLLIPKDQKIKTGVFGVQATKKPIVVEYYYNLSQEPSGEIIECDPPIKRQSMGIVVRGL